MEDNMIQISPIEYKRLVGVEARAQALMAYVNHTKYSVDRELIGGILGFHVGGRDECDREPNGE